MKKRISLLMVCMMVIVTMATACGGKDLSNSKYVGTWVEKPQSMRAWRYRSRRCSAIST